MNRLFPAAAVTLMGVNVVFLIHVAVSVGSQWEDWQQAEPLSLRLGPDPAVHLPLDGMGGIHYPRTEACLRLNGYLLDMIHLLSLHGVQSMAPVEAQKLADAGSCSMEEPSVREAVTDLNAAYESLGMPVILSPNWMH